MYKLFVFGCESSKGYMEQEMIASNEEEARRESINVLNGLYDFYPRRITLLRAERWEPPIFVFD